MSAALEELLGGYLPSLIVHASFELGVFDALPRTLAELATELDADPEALSRLVRALAVLGVVAFDGDRVVAEPVGELRDVARFHRELLLPPLLDLTAAVRSGRPRHATWPFVLGGVEIKPYDELAKHPRQLASLAVAMDRSSAGVGTSIAQTIDLSNARLLVDLGCGGGIVARELLAALPALSIESFDLPGTVEVARARSASAGLLDRHVIAVGDARAGVATRGADAVLLSAILADLTPAERVAALRGARASLAPHGKVVISETLLDDDRRGPAKAALLSLVTLAVTCGDQLTALEVTSALAAAGFERFIVYRRAPRDLIVAEL